MTTESPKADAWQRMAFFLAGIIVAGVGAFASYPRNVVTRDELPTLIANYSQYNATDVQRQLADSALHIGQLEAQVQQLQVDVARISEHLGVPPHPGK
jgi:ABC-type Fe2+-enterobactin transport system substrate-binding protein